MESKSYTWMVSLIALVLTFGTASAQGQALTSRGMPSRNPVPSTPVTAAPVYNSSSRLQPAEAPPQHGFLLHNGVFTSIDYPGAAQTIAYGISTAGEIVGEYGPDDYINTHGFLYSNGQFTTFDYPVVTREIM